MAISALTGYLSTTFNANVQGAATSSGLNLPAPSVAPTVTFKVPYTLGGNVANGANDAFQQILTMAASGSSTLNLQSLTDIMGAASVVLVRLKGFLLCLLSASQDSVNGTACSGVTIGNAGSNPNQLDMGATTHTRKLTNGDFTDYATGSAAGLTVSGTACNVLFTNNDSGNAAAVYAAGFGATS